MTFQPLTRPVLRDRLTSIAIACTIALSFAVSFAASALLPMAAHAIESPYAAIDAEAEEQATAEAFAAFPAPARRAGLVVAGYPEALLEVQRLQQYSADRFAALVEAYPRETQNQIWDLVRYPGLAADLARGGKKNSNELDDLADRYPSADHFAIIEEGRERHDLWVKIYSLDLESQQSLSTILSREPASVRAAFDDVTAQPELMTLLAENIQWTTVQGAAYLENPAAVDAQFERLSEQVAARQRAAESEWADEVANPESAEDLELAAREFAEAYDLDYEEELASAAARQPTSNTTIIIQQRVRPYPYWFGYPTWYDSAFWYPVSLSSHIGFGYGYGFGRGFGRGYASFGLPSPFFLGWYHDFYRPRYAQNRGHRRAVRYYDNHRPHRSVQNRRHGNRQLARRHLNSADRRLDRRDGRRNGHTGALRDRARLERRDARFETRRDRRSHTGALADRARRDQQRSNRDRTDLRERSNRRDRVDQRDRRNNRDLRQQARDQRRASRDSMSKQERQEQRNLRRSERGSNPAIRPGGRPAERVGERRNDGVRDQSGLRQARADVPRASKRERKAERRLARADRKAEKSRTSSSQRSERRSEKRIARTARKAERSVARSDRKSERRIARAQKKSSRREMRSSSGGGKRRMKAAGKSQRSSKRMSSGNRSRSGSKNRGGNRSNRGNRGNRKN
ncbi:MAG: hypothetical protein AB8G23_20770 [Myxococcota bacterium]